MTRTISPGSHPVRIAVIHSAAGSEHGVSLRSAENVCKALQLNFREVECLPFDASLAGALRERQPDVVFPVAHGEGGESGALQSLLDSMRLEYVGSGAASSAICWDKAQSNMRIANWATNMTTLGIDAGRFSVPPFVVLQRDDSIPLAVMDFCSLFPSGGSVVIKPACEGSSCGIAFCTMPDYKWMTKSEVMSEINGPIEALRLSQIVKCVERAFCFGNSVIVQEVIHGTEITVGVWEEKDAIALPVIEITTPLGSWYDYEHKYSPGGSEHIVPARLPADWIDLAQQVAISIHKHLGCRDYSRVDFIVRRAEVSAEPSQLCFLEINTLPGFTATSLFSDAVTSAAI